MTEIEMTSSTHSMAVQLDAEEAKSMYSLSSNNSLGDKHNHDNGKRKQSTNPENIGHCEPVQPPAQCYWGQFPRRLSVDGHSLRSRRRGCCNRSIANASVGREEFLGKTELPTGSLVSKRSRYEPTLEITSSGETAPEYERISPTTCTSPYSQNSGNGGYPTYNGSNGSNTEDKPCALDRFVSWFKTKFLRLRNILGLMAIVIGFKALVIMIVLLSTLGAQGHRRCARTAFCMCSVSLALSCGLFAAAIGRSLGEVVILMTFLLCLGILLSSQFDAMMGFTWDAKVTKHSHG